MINISDAQRWARRGVDRHQRGVFDAFSARVRQTFSLAAAKGPIAASGPAAKSISNRPMRASVTTWRHKIVEALAPN
jgi:hypothetical protein